MKESGNIEKLFKDAFEHFEADVNPSVWAHVQSGMQSAAGSAASSASAFTAGKIIAGIASVALISGSIWYYTSSSSGENKNVQLVSEKQTAAPVTPGVKENISSANGPPATVQKTSGPETDRPASQMPPSVRMLNHYSSEGYAQQTRAARQAGDEVVTSDVSALEPKENNPPVHKYGNATQGDGGMMRGINNSPPSSSGSSQQLQDEEVPVPAASLFVNASPMEVKATAYLTNIPNIFTPNGDGENDYFYFDTKNIVSIGVAIYSQKESKQVYTWNALDGNWNGKLMNGQDAPDGVYLYSVQAIGSDGLMHPKTGFVTLSRKRPY